MISNSPVCPDFKLHWHDADDADEVFRHWRELESEIDLPLTASIGWTNAWLSSYGQEVPHRFVVGRVNNEVKAICLVTNGVDVRDGPLRIQSTHIGTAGESESHGAVVEYNAVAGAPEDRGPFLERVVAQLRENQKQDEIRLDGFESDELGWLAREGWFIKEMASPYFDLAAARRDNAEDLVTYLGTKTRRNLRQNFRMFDSLTVDWSDGVEQSLAFFDQLVQLHQKRWQAQGLPGSYANMAFVRFNKALIRELAPPKKTAIIRINADGAPMGYVHVLIDRQRVLKYQSGIQAYSGSRHSPGMLADFMCIDSSYRRGFDAFDFECGALQSKSKLSTAQNTMIWARYREPRLKFRALDGLRVIRSGWRSLTAPKPEQKKAAY